MHRRAIVLAFLPSALEVLAFLFVKCSSSEAFRSTCRRHEYACVSCLCMSCVVLSCAVLCCRIVTTVELETKCVWCLACCVRGADPVSAMRRHFHERVLSWTRHVPVSSCEVSMCFIFKVPRYCGGASSLDKTVRLLYKSPMSVEASIWVCECVCWCVCVCVCVCLVVANSERAFEI